MNPGPVLAYMKYVRFVLVTLAMGLLCAPASADRKLKPSAPVEIRLESRAIKSGYEVRLIATPTRDLPTLELTLAGKQVSYGATAAGQVRELVTEVPMRGVEGLDVVGSARAGGRNRAQILRVGKPKLRAAKQVKIYTLPDGRQIGEVR